jgi:hypothetical protein
VAGKAVSLIAGGRSTQRTTFLLARRLVMPNDAQRLALRIRM